MTFKKGNKFALGITTNGKPPVFDSPEAIETKINEYFESLLDEKGEEYKNRPTITGLALFLGFASRQSLHDYLQKDDYSYIIKRAQQIVAMSYEEMLLTRVSTGAIFALKNMGWKDEQKVVQTNLNSKELTEKEIKELDSKLENDY